MGLVDRNYMRDNEQSPRRRGRMPWRGGRAGFSITGWLIGLNILIFVLSKFVFVGVKYDSYQPYGQVYFTTTTPAEVAAGRVSNIEPRAAEGPYRGLFQQPIIAFQPGMIVPRHIGYQLYMRMNMLEAWGHFSTARGFYPGLEVWRFVTFQFLHADITHLAFNLLGLWFFAPLVEGQLGRKRFAAFYLASGIFGALLYLLLNFTGNLLMHASPGLASFAQHVPFLLFDSSYTPLIGASAGIFGVLLAAAYIAPHDQVLIFGIIPAPLRIAVYAFTIISLVSLIMGSQNRGGEAAHIGGAIAGAFFIRRMHLLRDFFDIFGDSRPPRTLAADAAARKRVVAPDPASAAEVDRILKKIKDEGIASLTEGERATLRAQSRGGA